MSKKIVAFHSYQLGERGTEIHMYNLAKYNRDILGNESIIISTSSRPTPTLSMFEKEFKTFLYSDVWNPNGVNLNLRTSIEKICEDNNVTHFWATKGGESDGIMPSNAKSIAACIFRMDQPHGDIYSGICEYISNKHGGGFPYVYPIIEKDFPDYTDDFREELNIPKEALVFGRHGGKDSFSLPFAKDAIVDSLSKRDDIYFLFLNTEVFINHPRVIHIGWSPDFELKSKFVNTCDVMIHARYDGEIFSQAVAEFSVRNKPVITWKPDVIPSHYDTGHIWILGDNAFYYRDRGELINILTSISKNDFIEKDWDVYKDKYSAENVMRDFDRIFLS
jgi:hypothetical protein